MVARHLGSHRRRDDNEPDSLLGIRLSVVAAPFVGAALLGFGPIYDMLVCGGGKSAIEPPSRRVSAPPMGSRVIGTAKSIDFVKCPRNSELLSGAQTDIADCEILGNNAFTYLKAALTVKTNVIRLRPMLRGVVVMSDLPLLLVGEILLSFFVRERHGATYIRPPK